MNNQDIWTIGRMLQWTEQYFRSRGIDSARLDGEVLLSHMLGKERIYCYTHYDQPLTDKELDLFRPMVVERAKGLSVAAITGEKDFMGLTFKVNRDVLIPRPDTESIVEVVLERYDRQKDWKILDICTGSGAILLSLLHYLPKAAGVGLDISLPALQVAELNRRELELEERASFFQSDLLTALPAEEKSFDIIVSNPPYIATGEIDTLQPEVLNEPRLALDGGSDGLDFYRRILLDASGWLVSGGALAVEIGAGQAEAVAALAKDAGCYSEEERIADLGGIIRVLLWHKV